MLSALQCFSHITLLTSASVGTEFLALGNVGTSLGENSAGYWERFEGTKFLTSGAAGFTHTSLLEK